MSIDNSNALPYLLWSIGIGAVLMAAIFALEITIVLLSCRSRISAKAMDFALVDLGEVPARARERAERAAAELASLGFVTIGTCNSLWSTSTAIWCSVWVCRDIIAEIAITSNISKMNPSVTVAVGQEYSDGSSIVVLNCPEPFPSLNAEAMFLAYVDDIQTLKEVLNTIIQKRRQNRTPWTPTNAAEYKSSEIKTYLNELVKLKYYWLDSKRGFYRPTLKYAYLHELKSSRLSQGSGSRKAKRLLNELGFKDLRLSGTRQAGPVR